MLYGGGRDLHRELSSSALNSRRRHERRSNVHDDDTVYFRRCLASRLIYHAVANRRDAAAQPGLPQCRQVTGCYCRNRSIP